MMDRYFELNFVGTGGEFCIGTITAEQFRYWCDNDKFEKYMADIDSTWMGNRGVDQAELNKDIPTEAHFDRPYHEYCDICKVTGIEWKNENTLILKEYDNEKKLLNEKEYNLSDLENKGTELKCTAEHNSSSESCKDHYYVFGRTLNEGLMGFNQKIIQTGPEGFDFGKLEISYDYIGGTKVVDKVAYGNKFYGMTEDSSGAGYVFYVGKGSNLK